MKKMDFDEKKNLIKSQFGYNQDLIAKEFLVDRYKTCLFYINGISDVEKINQFVLSEVSGKKIDKKIKIIDAIMQKIISVSEVEKTKDFNIIISSLAKGKCVILVDREDEYIILGLDKTKERSITEPPTNAVMKGPREGFVENIKTNLSLVRKILATNKLRVEYLAVGELTKTTVALAYIEGVCDKNIVKQIYDKINSIKIDGVIDSFYISQFLEYRKNSCFKQVGSTEKPDIACAKVLEGRVLILVDGSPIVLTLPFVLWEELQSSGDYYSQHANATFLRVLRLSSMFITMLLPAMYIAVELHHYKSVPLTFLITIINTTQDLPLTPFAEILFVLILFEILYETSVRMPKYLGLALSVVGALILGDTAVKAGLISPPAVMFVAVSGITQYTIPDQMSQLRLLRFAFTLAGGFLGFYGLVLFMMFLVFYLNDFDSYGTAYLAPFAPYKMRDMQQDGINKNDITDIKFRPQTIPSINKRRLK